VLRAAPGRIVIEAAHAPRAGVSVAGRLPLSTEGGYIALDQLRTIDRERIARKLGRLNTMALTATLSLLQEFFAP
jgi:mRNA interferase MazF